MSIKVEFSGGLESVFDNTVQKNVTLAALTQGTIGDLIVHLRDNHVSNGKPELFAAGDKVRPGVLVLVNDTDWELLEGNETELEEGDTVTFLSTLHGG